MDTGKAPCQPRCEAAGAERSRGSRARSGVPDRLGQRGKAAAAEGVGDLVARMWEYGLHYMSMSAPPALAGSLMAYSVLAESVLADGGTTDDHRPDR